ncbi:MAG: DHA2 family efflux MFS transporter permease subunit [Solirubrobacterales bacterium]
MSRQQRLTLIVAILGSTVVFLDGTVVNVALPAIADKLDAGLAGQQWVVEAYMLTLVALLLVGGSLGDQFGRRRIFVIGLIGFAVTSVLCAIAPSVEVLIAGRALQGVAGALLVPGSLALVAASFEGAARGRAVGTWTAWTGIAVVVGPAGGGALVEALSWRAIFWINIPLIAFTVALTLRSVRESSDPDAFRGLDWPGILLSAAGLGAPVFALIEQPSRGWGDPLVLIPLLAGIVCLGLFVLRELHARHPMLDLALFRIRNFWVANVTTFAAYGGLIAGLFFITIFLQQVSGYSPIEAGLATTPISVVLFLLSPRFGRLASGTGPRLPMTAGPIVAGIGLLLLLRVDADAAYVTEVLPGVLVFSLGLAATVAPLTATVLDSVNERQVGIASGANNGIARVAGLLGIAVLGVVIAAQFEATAGPGVSGGPLTAAAPEASTAAFHLGIAIAGLMMIAGGIVAGFGIQNPERHVEAFPAGSAAAAGECGHGTDADHVPSSPAPTPAPIGETL